MGRPAIKDLVMPELSAQDRYRKHFRIKYLLKLAERRAIARGIPFDIEESDIEVTAHCPLLGIPYDNYSDDVDTRMSLDRMDYSKGYVKGNVLLVSHRANRLKNNATSEELFTLATNMKRMGL